MVATNRIVVTADALELARRSEPPVADAAREDPAPTMLPPVTGIVLAGGASRRFGRDKLAEPVAGQPLLARAVTAVAAVCGEVVIVVAPGAPDPSVEAGPAVSVRVVRDAVAHQGPLAGLAAGLADTTTPLAVVVGGDMPVLVPALLEALVRRLAEHPEDGPALAVLGAGGWARPLPGALRVAAARPVVEVLLRSGERRLRAIFDAVATLVLPEAEWRPFDPDGASLRDVDRPEDLRPG